MMINNWLSNSPCLYWLCHIKYSLSSWSQKGGTTLQFINRLHKHAVKYWVISLNQNKARRFWLNLLWVEKVFPHSQISFCFFLSHFNVYGTNVLGRKAIQTSLACKNRILTNKTKRSPKYKLLNNTSRLKYLKKQHIILWAKSTKNLNQSHWNLSGLLSLHRHFHTTDRAVILG